MYFTGSLLQSIDWVFKPGDSKSQPRGWKMKSQGQKLHSEHELRSQRLKNAILFNFRGQDFEGLKSRLTWIGYKFSNLEVQKVNLEVEKWNLKVRNCILNMYCVLRGWKMQSWGFNFRGQDFEGLKSRLTWIGY